MRTTVEIRDDLGERLRVLAGSRGEEGISRLIAEAVESYFAEQPDQRDLEAALNLQGSLSDEEAEHFRKVTRELRAIP